jgi:hypothetical protein
VTVTLRPSKPAFVRLLAFFLAFWAAIVLPMSLTVLGGGGDSFSINGAQVTREEFMRRAGDAFALGPVLALFAFAAAWGLYRERSWGRPITVLLILAAGVSPAPFFARDPELGASWPSITVGMLLIAAPLLWYFYFKQNVVLYYRQLGTRSRKAAPDQIARRGS